MEAVDKVPYHWTLSNQITESTTVEMRSRDRRHINPIGGNAMHNNLEPCFNVWVFMDPATRVVQQMSAKAYALGGSDEDKLRMLRALAATDFWTALRVSVPERHVVMSPDGRRAIAGAVMVGDIERAGLIEDAISSVERMPAQLSMRERVPTAVHLPVPESPLMVTTVVEERLDGTLVPLVKRGGDAR